MRGIRVRRCCRRVWQQCKHMRAPTAGKQLRWRRDTIVDRAADGCVSGDNATVSLLVGIRRNDTHARGGLHVQRHTSNDESDARHVFNLRVYHVAPTDVDGTRLAPHTMSA